MTDAKSDDDGKNTPVAPQGEISATASAYAPTHFFEGVPFYGANNGIGTLALSATRLVNAVNGEVVFDQALTAHLKGSLHAYRLLGQTIDAIIKCLEAEERQKIALRTFEAFDAAEGQTPSPLQRPN